MNDVLPKPFTKEGLLTMLEKHLGHLKSQKDGDNIQPSSATHAQPRAGLKEETSSTKSPGGSTWQSPNQMPGVSPTGHALNDEYMNALRGNAAYGLNGGMPPEGMGYHGAGASSMSAPRQGAHRRQISDISSEEEVGGDAKRARVFAPPLTNATMASMHRVRPGV